VDSPPSQPQLEILAAGHELPGQQAPSAALPLPPWDMYTVAVSLVSGYILIPLLITKVLMLMYPFLGETEQLFSQQAITLVAWVSIFACLRWRYGPIMPYLGLVFNRPATYYVWETVQLILLTTGLTLALNFSWTLVAKYIPGWQPEGRVPYADFSSAELVVLTLFAVLMAPVLEELIFRGLVQSTFHKLCRPALSVLMATLVFLLLHGSYFSDIKALAHVLVLGLCFAIWRERTQSLIPSMAAHWFNNGLASMMLLMQAAK
jgi:membrane protease YdiL (CAAX protease family)